MYIQTHMYLILCSFLLNSSKYSTFSPWLIITIVWLTYLLIPDKTWSTSGGVGQPVFGWYSCSMYMISPAHTLEHSWKWGSPELCNTYKPSLIG